MLLLCFFFLRLKPFTSYQFRVKATNDIGDSEYSQESEAITTLQDGKRRGPKKAPHLPNTGTSLSACLYSTVLNCGFFAVDTLRQQCMCLLRRRSATDCLNYVSLLSAVLVCELQIPFIFPIFRHLSLAPDRAPTILSVTPHTTTSVLVRWQVR